MEQGAQPVANVPLAKVLVMVDDSHAVGFVGRVGAARRNCTASTAGSTS
jgi:hypothetical protein